MSTLKKVGQVTTPDGRQGIQYGKPAENGLVLVMFPEAQSWFESFMLCDIKGLKRVRLPHPPSRATPVVLRK